MKRQNKLTERRIKGFFQTLSVFKNGDKFVIKRLLTFQVIKASASHEKKYFHSKLHASLN